MKKAKLRKAEETKEMEVIESYSIKSVIKIILVVAIIFAIFYAITTIVVEKTPVSEENSVVVIDSTKITLGQLLNRKEEQYFVLATKPSLYKSANTYANYTEFYNNYINKYNQQTDSLEFYYVDLDDAMNKRYFGEELNITDEMDKLMLNDEVLFKINNGKIEKSYVGKDSIIEKLSNIQKS